MPYDEALDLRIRKTLAQRDRTEAKKMFGGVCHLLNGNMVFGVHRDNLVLRLEPEQAANALEQPFVKPFDITGKPMKGWVMVEAQGLAETGAMAKWLDLALEFVRTLPPK